MALPVAGVDYAVPPFFPTPGQSLATPLTAGIGGNVYFVKKATDRDYSVFLATHYRMYGDGTVSVYNTVQAAHNAIYSACGGTLPSVCKARGDVIYVCPPDQGLSSANTKINENAYILVPGLKIFALARWWEAQWRASDATTKYPFTPGGGSATNGCCLFLLARGIEVAGFNFDGGGGYCGIYIGDGSVAFSATNPPGVTNSNVAACWVHDCLFTGGNEGQYGIVLDGCSADVVIERCSFTKWDLSCIYAASGTNRTCQQPIIRQNAFWASPGGGFGFDMQSSATSVGFLIDGNVFRDGAAATFTNPIRTLGAGVHAITNNAFACANAWTSPATDWQSNNAKFNIAGSVTSTTAVS